MDDIRNRLDRVEHKMDNVFENTVEQTTILALIRKDLNYHILRTDLLQEDLKQVKTDIAPLGWLTMSAKILAWLVPIIAATYSIYELLHR